MANVSGWDYEDVDGYEVVSGQERSSAYYETILPPLPAREKGMVSYSVRGNPSYQVKTQEEMSLTNQLYPSLSPTPSYDFLPSNHKFKTVKKQVSPNPLKDSVDSSIKSVPSLSGSREGVIAEVEKSLSSIHKSQSLDSEAKDPQAVNKLNVATPTGYNLMDVFSNGNIIFILPRGSEKRLPLTTNGKTIRGGGTFNDDSKFEVTIPRRHSTECVVALRSVKYSERYLCINSKAKIKLHDGYKDSCDFFVNEVSSSFVCFESARTDGFYLGIKAKNTVSDASNITSDSMEAHFTIIADTFLNSIPSSKLTAFGEDSLMNHVQDKNVIRLYSHRRYLGVDKKGRVMQNHNSENPDCWFLLFDRGMGIVSLRSYKHSAYWLRVLDGQLLVMKGVFGPDALFYVKESAEHLVCFESVLQPGMFVVPPLHNTATTLSPQFTLEIVILPQM
ncbi:uncharacterized protein LOC135344379 [Halichondria panicea]|uniref:uncharacterized protein LOC135344379 n=1 Tax=Halichondria panicea TaxID=6063 RepID=UPI00312BAB01